MEENAGSLGPRPTRRIPIRIGTPLTGAPGG